MIDLLPGRDAAPFGRLARRALDTDRATAYARGARTGALDAVQVADRFHLWQTLAQADERCITRYKNCLQESVIALVDEQPDTAEGPEPGGAMAQRRRERHELVHDLLGQGAGFDASPGPADYMITEESPALRSCWAVDGLQDLARLTIQNDCLRAVRTHARTSGGSTITRCGGSKRSQ